MNLDIKKIKVTEWDGIDHSDYPDYVDAFIVSAEYDGIPMTSEQIESLSDECVYELLMDYLF